MSDNQYFAAKESDEIAHEICKRVDDYREFLITSGRLNLWRRSYEFYYQPAINGSKLAKVGEQGEFTKIDINHYRSLLTNLKTMTTQQRPAFEPRATNTDYKSQAQTILAGGLLDYYLREKKLERYIKIAVENSLMFGEAFVSADWDATSGEEYGINPDTGATIFEGDIEYKNYIPLDVARDHTKESSNEHDWYILITRKNRYSLAAKYPELADKILMLPSMSDKDYRIDRKTARHVESDDVEVYVFVHKPTPALPEGRMTEVCGSDITLIDGALPYRTLPVYRIAPEDQTGTCFGYTVGFDLMPVQEAINMLYSTVITNQSSFGVQNLAVPRGSNLSVEQLVDGLNLIEYDPALGKPEPLNLTNTPAEIFNFINQLEKLMETLSGVNSVARGNPEASLKSGAALALVQSMAVQFSINLQQSYASLLEDLGTATINMLRDFATVPRIAVIAGKSNRSLMKQFTGDDLDMINRVVVDMGNALSKTTAGKIQLADTLLEKGLIKTADEYIMVLVTGKLEPAIEGTQAELLNIRAENEELAEGNSVPVMITDEHYTHIQEHKSILASPEARRNPELIKVVTAHLQEHLNILQDPGNAAMLGLLGQQAIAPPAPQPGQDPIAGVMDATPSVLQAADRVNTPNMPTNPLTGEKADPLGQGPGNEEII